MILVKIARGSYDPGHMLEFKRSRYSSTAAKGRQQAGGGHGGPCGRVRVLRHVRAARHAWH